MVRTSNLGSWNYWPNSSDEDVSCACHGASLQILFKCPAILFGNATNPSRFAMQRHLNLQKWSEPLVFLTFWLRNVLRATTACTFSTSQLAKVVRTGVFCTFWLRNVLRATTACNFSSLIWPDGSAPAALAYFSTLRSHKSLEKHSEACLQWACCPYFGIDNMVSCCPNSTNWRSSVRMSEWSRSQAKLALSACLNGLAFSESRLDSLGKTGRRQVLKAAPACWSRSRRALQGPRRWWK